MSAPWHSFRVDPKIGPCIRISGIVGEFGDNGNATLEALGDAPAVSVFICSSGGDSRVGVRWFDALRARDATVYMSGHVCSSAAIIALAGKRRFIAHDAAMMVHAPCAFVLGNVARLRFEAERLAPVHDRFAEIIGQRTGQPASVVESWLAERDVWFTPDEAIAAGLADEVTPHTRYELATATEAAELENVDNGNEALCFDMLRLLGEVRVANREAFAQRLQTWFSTEVKSL